VAQQHEENGGDLAADEAEAVHPYELAPVHNADVLDQLRVPAKEHTNEQKHNNGMRLSNLPMAGSIET